MRLEPTEWRAFNLRSLDQQFEQGFSIARRIIFRINVFTGILSNLGPTISIRDCPLQNVGEAAGLHILSEIAGNVIFDHFVDPTT